MHVHIVSDHHPTTKELLCCRCCRPMLYVSLVVLYCTCT